MSKLVFDGNIYILKRNSFANVLFILLLVYSLFSFYTNYPSILTMIKSFFVYTCLFGGLIIIFGLIWNTDHAAGVLFYQPFKHYLNHGESSDDRFNAKFSFVSSILIILILLFLLFNLSSYFP